MGDGFELSLSAVDAAVAGDLANVDDLYVAWDGSASSSVLTGEHPFFFFFFFFFFF